MEKAANASDNIVPLRARHPERRRLPEQAASHVRELIMSGALRPGDFLRVEPIAEAVGVSSTPVREGLLTLRSEGLVQLVPRRGFVVAEFTRQDVHDLVWAHAALAGELAARAAATISAARIRTLEELLERFEEACAAHDREGIATLGYAFHREINIAARSSRLALLLASVAKHVPSRLYATVEGQVDAAREEHPALLAALRERSAERARSIMEEHVLSVADHLIAALEHRGLWRS